MLTELMKTFREHQKDLATKYHGEYVLISVDGILGTFPSDIDAYWNAVDEKNLVPGDFLIHPCCFPHEERPVMFYSNVE